MKFNFLYFKPYKDLFNLYNKIQKINIGFRLFFNTKTKKFAVVNINNNYEICKEFYAFSENIEKDLRFFKIENYNKILKYIDEENYINKTKINKNNHETSYGICQELKIISSRSNQITNNDINKIIGATKC